jgi:uncharacterized RDD family membrane protein YckC
MTQFPPPGTDDNSTWQAQPPASPTPMAAMPPSAFSQQATLQTAGMGIRFMARFLDGLIYAVVYVPLVLIFGGGLTPGDMQLSIGLSLLTYLLVLAYEVPLVALRGATLGKQAAGIKVVRDSDGQIPGWQSAGIRAAFINVNYLLPQRASLIGLLMALSPFFDGTGKRQGWHDKAAKTRVVKA